MHAILRRAQCVAGLLALCAVGVSLTGCSPRAAPGNETGIGIAVALDPHRQGMQTIYNGVQLAVDQLNGQRNGGARLTMNSPSHWSRDLA